MTKNSLKLNPSGKVKKWRCIVCGEVFEGVLPPEKCPVCGVGQDMFEIVEDEEVTFKSDSTETILIIGNNAAGISAAQAVRARNTKCELIIISKDRYNGYYRPSISNFLTVPPSPDEFFLKSDEWYVENNIKVRLDTEVISIQPEKNQITIKTGENLNYGKLILANGSIAFLPPIENVDLSGVFVLKTYDDILNIKEYCKDKKSVTVVGGGVLGLEAAWKFKQTGLNVTVIEMAERILPMQLDNNGSNVFQKYIEKSGIKLIKGDFVSKINGETRVESVETSGGKTIQSDLVIVSTGIRSNISLAKKCGIDTSRGVIVNEKMVTSIENIYAAGDVAQFNGAVIAIWPVANNMGEVAGANSVGDDLTYIPEHHAITFSGMNVELFSLGDIGRNSEIEYKTLDYDDPGEGQYRKLYFKGNEFSGGILVGDISTGVVLIKAITKKAGPDYFKK
jgi:NADH oxidase (H2O-forming)